MIWCESVKSDLIANPRIIQTHKWNVNFQMPCSTTLGQCLLFLIGFILTLKCDVIQLDWGIEQSVSKQFFSTVFLLLISSNFFIPKHKVNGLSHKNYLKNVLLINGNITPGNISKFIKVCKAAKILLNPWALISLLQK